MMFRNYRGYVPLVMSACCALSTLFVTVEGRAEEVVVQNDSVIDGSLATICPCFVEGESAAVWLTAPCDGNIVAVQIFWRSWFGGAPQSLEDRITIFEGGTYPTPGAQLLELIGPVLTDGVTNEWRYTDEPQTIPINVPVTNGQVFVVSLKFYNDSPGLGPSIVFDADGIQPNKNAVFSIDDGWVTSESLGVSGDWFIRAVIDCQEANGACCDLNAVCVDDVDEGDCQDPGDTFYVGQTCTVVEPCPTPTGACCNGLGGCVNGVTQYYCENTLPGDWYYAGNGTQCVDNVCKLGACCMPDGSCQNVIEIVCNQLSGAFEGPLTECVTTECTQPLGACCIGELCQPDQFEIDCIGVGTWVGPFTDCGPPDPCQGCPAPPDGNINGDANIDGIDIQAFVTAIFGTPTQDEICAGDFDDDGGLDDGDIPGFVAAILAG